MINSLALLAILLGLTAIGLAVKLSMMVERKTNESAGWRIYASYLQDQANKPTVIGALPPSSALQAAALDLIAECELLERRNEWLESQRDHCKDVIAMSMAQDRIPRRDKRMEVAETGRMP